MVIITTRMDKSRRKSKRIYLPIRLHKQIKVILALSVLIIMSTILNNSNDDEMRCSILNKTPQELSELTEIDLKGCLDKELPASIQYATNIVKLDLSGNEKLTTLPAELAK